MRRLLPPALVTLVLIFLSSGSAFGQGSCPSASTYTNPSGVGASGSLSNFGITSCYYIDFSAGSDSNNGTSKSSPWKHAPGMQGCSSTCASTTPRGGQGFIFKGGVTWDYTTQLWTWSWSGGSGSPIYLGYDPSWYSGSSWTRPVISGSGKISTQMSMSGTYVNVDNFEFANMFNNQGCCSQNVYAFAVTNSGNRSVNLYNSYFHGARVAHDGQHSSHFISWPTGGNDNTSTTHHNVLDNSDVCTPPGPCTMTGQEGGPRQIFLNYYGYMGGSLLVVDDPVDFHNNTLEWQVLSPDNGTDHENMFESNGETGSGMVMYNNVVRHGYYAGVVDFQMGPNAGMTSYAFNNVLPDMDGGNMQQTYEGNSGGTAYWFNNTAEGGPESNVSYNSNSNPPSGQCGRSTSSSQTSYVINQHCITTKSGNSWWSGGSGNAFTTNLGQSQSTANSQGYSLAGAAYSFEPTSANGATVGAGTNQMSLCNAIGNGATAIAAVNAAAEAACKQDTSYGAAYDTSTHTITGPGRSSTNARPSSGAWDIGAYQFSAGGVSPAAPTGLSAIVQ